MCVRGRGVSLSVVAHLAACHPIVPDLEWASIRRQARARIEGDGGVLGGKSCHDGKVCPENLLRFPPRPTGERFPRLNTFPPPNREEPAMHGLSMVSLIWLSLLGDVQAADGESAKPQAAIAGSLPREARAI